MEQWQTATASFLVLQTHRDAEAHVVPTTPLKAGHRTAIISSRCIYEDEVAAKVE